MPDTSFAAKLEPLPSRMIVLFLAAICAAASLLYGIYFNGIGPDDPWITYRYAENIAAGNGFVFNVGERVYGTSTPLYALILAAARLIGLPVPQTSWVIGFVSMNAAIVMLFLLVKRLHSEAAGLVAAGLLGSAYLFHRVATFGMETPLYTALIIGAFLAYAYGRELLAAAIAAACLVMRLDGAAVGAALALTHVVTRRQMPWKQLAVYAVVIAPWFIFATSYFGSPLPNTMLAKRMHTGYTRLYWMPEFLFKEPRAWMAVVGVAAALSTSVLRSRALGFALWTAMYIGAYSMVAMHRYDWYLTPLLPGLAAFAGIGVVWLAARLVQARPRVWVVAGALATVLLGLDAARAGWRILGHEGVLEIERTRTEAARWMRDNLPANAPIATGGIGLVGYHTGRRIYDAMGLVTPGSMRLNYTIDNPKLVPFPRFLPAIIEDYDPEFVFDGFELTPGEEMPAFMKQRYEVMKVWPTDNRYLQFVLYRRVAPDIAFKGAQ